MTIFGCWWQQHLEFVTKTLVTNIDVIKFLEWVEETPVDVLRYNSTMNYGSVTESEKNDLMQEYDFNPAALYQSEKFDAKEFLARVSKVSTRTVFPVNFRSK